MTTFSETVAAITGEEVAEEEAAAGDELVLELVPGRAATWVPGGGYALRDLGLLRPTDLIGGPVAMLTPAAGSLVQIYSSDDQFEALATESVQAGLYLDVVVPSLSQDTLPGLTWTNHDQYGNSVSVTPFPTRSIASPGAVLWAALITAYFGLSLAVAPVAWQALHVYPAFSTILFGSTYFSTEFGGTSDVSIPDFAGAPAQGDPVMDGTVEWSNDGDVPTQGAVHVFATVAAPS